MPRGVNRVTLIGHLGADPETRHTTSGASVTNARLATSESWKDKSTGQQQERTEWHSLVFFGRLAEIASEYLRKGSQVYVEGRIQTRKWSDKDGQDRYSTEIVCNEMQMLGGKGGDAPRREAQQAPPQSRPAAGNDFDSDIPFDRLRNEYAIS